MTYKKGDIKATTTKLKIPPKYMGIINEMTVDGYSGNDIKKFFKDKGIDVSISTISKYLTRFREERKEASKELIYKSVSECLPHDLEKVSDVIDSMFEQLMLSVEDPRHVRVYSEALYKFIKLRLELIGIDFNKDKEDAAVRDALLKKLGL